MNSLIILRYFLFLIISLTLFPYGANAIIKKPSMEYSKNDSTVVKFVFLDSLSNDTLILSESVHIFNDSTKESFSFHNSATALRSLSPGIYSVMFFGTRFEGLVIKPKQLNVATFHISGGYLQFLMSSSKPIYDSIALVETTDTNPKIQYYQKIDEIKYYPIGKYRCIVYSSPVTKRSFTLESKIEYTIVY